MTSSSSTQDEVYDACIIGGGISGCIIARDVASSGYKHVVVLEGGESIGGVWNCNDYLGLRLHGISAPYRSWTHAPKWQKDEKISPLYRPTRSEILDYIHSLANHESISVRTNSEYKAHQAIQYRVNGSEKLYEVTLFNKKKKQTETISARTVVFATGIGETLSGEPCIPINLKSVRNGAIALHSSQMSSLSESTLCDAEKIYVVGSSKAAVDVLRHFLSQVPSLVDKIQWAHRGHIIFACRESVESWMISSNPILQRLRRALSQSGSRCCFYQRFNLLSTILRFSKVYTHVGLPFAKVPFRGGIESKQVLQNIQTAFGRGEILLKQGTSKEGSEGISLNSNGAVLLHGEDSNVYKVGNKDVIIFCTGQRRRNIGGSLGIGNFSLDPASNSEGVFTVQGYSQVYAVSAVLTGGLVVAHLDKMQEKTLYSSGDLAVELIRVQNRLEIAKKESAWGKTMMYFGGMFLHIQPKLAPGILGDMGFHHQWQSDWFGKDLDVRKDLVPLLIQGDHTMSITSVKLACVCTVIGCIGLQMMYTKR